MAQSGHNPSRLDPVIRQAMHMATNKAYITENMYMEYATPGSTLVPPINSYWHYEPTEDERLDYNITMAADLLEANGYIDIDSDGVRECTISSKAVQMGWVAEGTSLEYEMFVRKEYPEEKDIAMFLRNQLQQIGVLVQYMVVEEITLAQIAYSYNYDTLIWYWSADPDPNYILFVQSRNAWSGWSDNKYTNAAFEENYTNSVKSLDEAQRKGYVDNCQKIHYNDSAYVVLAYPDQTYAWRTDTFSGWGNWSTHPGRSLDNYWSGNPLFFDLTPEAPSDTDPPSASAGPDMKVKAGTTVVFNGGYSEDNVGIVNFTWSFTYGGEEIEIYGLISSWKFDETGIYPVTLRVEDLAGLTDNDTATVTVEAKGNVLTDYWWIAPIAVGAVAVAATAVLLLRRIS